MLEIARIRPFKAVRGVTVLADLTKVRLRRLVAVGALVVGLAHALVTVMTPDVGMRALEGDRMRLSGIQVHRRPGPTMA